MSNNQPPGSNAPLFRLDQVGQNPLDLRAHFHMWNIEDNLRSLVRYLTGNDNVERLLLGNNGGGVGGGGRQAGPSSLNGHLLTPAESLQPMRGPGPNAQPPLPNDQGAMQGMQGFPNTYGAFAGHHNNSVNNGGQQQQHQHQQQPQQRIPTPGAGLIFNNMPTLDGALAGGSGRTSPNPSETSADGRSSKKTREGASGPSKRGGGAGGGGYKTAGGSKQSYFGVQ